MWRLEKSQFIHVNIKIGSEKLPYKRKEDKAAQMRRYRKRNKGRRRKQMLELKHAIDDLENLVHKGV